MAPRPARIVGLLLAAGSGRRFGTPKALVDTGDGPWVLRALRTLDGFPERIVVVGAAADRVTALLPRDVTAVYNPDHAGGMGSSLAAGLRALSSGVDAAMVMLVDLPDVPAAAVHRVAAVAGDSGHARTVLARAAYRRTPGHPVLIGADHVPGVLASAGGDRGARDYLARRDVILVECGDLAGGADVDVPPAGSGGQPGGLGVPPAGSGGQPGGLGVPPAGSGGQTGRHSRQPGGLGAPSTG